MLMRSVEFPGIRCESCGEKRDGWLVSDPKNGQEGVVPPEVYVEQTASRERREFWICQDCSAYEPLFPVGITEAEIDAMVRERDEIARWNADLIARRLPDHAECEAAIRMLDAAREKLARLSGHDMGNPAGVACDEAVDAAKAALEAAKKYHLMDKELGEE